MKKILGMGLLVLISCGCDSAKELPNEEKFESSLTLSYEGSINGDNIFIIKDKKTLTRYLYIKRWDSRAGCSLVQMKD